MQVSAPGPATFEKQLVAPFMESVATVFRTMIGVDVRVSSPYVKITSGQFNVFGIIGFSGELRGNVVVSFTQDSAEKVVEAFTGEKVDRGSPQFSDAVGELANMIVGSAKSKLGFNANISVPSVVMGDCQIATPSDVPCVVIPCTSPIGDFAVEVCIRH